MLFIFCIRLNLSAKLFCQKLVNFPLALPRSSPFGQAHPGDEKARQAEEPFNPLGKVSMCRKESQPLGLCDTLLAEAKDGRRTTIVCLRSSRYALFAFYQVNYFSLMPGTGNLLPKMQDSGTVSTWVAPSSALEHHHDAHDHASMNSVFACVDGQSIPGTIYVGQCYSTRVISRLLRPIYYRFNNFASQAM